MIDGMGSWNTLWGGEWAFVASAFRLKWKACVCCLLCLMYDTIIAESRGRWRRGGVVREYKRYDYPHAESSDCLCSRPEQYAITTKCPSLK
jgi:hypothetical protein